MTQRVKNPTSIHEDVGLIPGVTQWVKDLTLLWLRHYVYSLSFPFPCLCLLNALYLPNLSDNLLHLKKQVWFRVSAPGRATRQITSWKDRPPEPKERH